MPPVLPMSPCMGSCATPPSIPARQTTEEQFQSRSDLLCLDCRPSCPLQVSAVFSIPPNRLVLMAPFGMAATNAACVRRNRPGFCQEGSTATSRVARRPNTGDCIRMTVTAQYARQTNCHASPFAVPPSHEATMKSCGPDDLDPGRTAADLGSPRRTAEKAGAGAKWTYLSQSPTRAPRASLSPRRLVVLQSPFSCTPRSTPLLAAFPACDYLPVLRTHIASIVFHRPERDTHESTPAAIDAAFSHTGPFSIHGVAPVTRLSLGTRLHNRRFSFYASSPAIMRARSPTPTLASKKAQACTPTIFRSTAAHLQSFHRPSSTPSTPTALECRKRHAPRLPALLAARTLQRDGSTVPPSLLEARTCCALQRVSWPFPIAGASFIASSCTELVYGKQDSTRPRARFRASPTRHRPPRTCSAHAAAAPQRSHRLDHLPAVASASPPSDGSRLLSGAGSTMRSTTGMLSECGGRSPTPNAGLIAFPWAVPILCADAGLRSETPPPAHSDAAARTTMQRDSRPGVERVAPPPPLGDVDSSRASYTFMRRGAIASSYASFEAGRLELAPRRRVSLAENIGAAVRGSARTIPILVPSAGATSTAPPVSALGASLMVGRPPYRPVLLRAVVVEALRVQ
ncbi:hypothetical protein B0H14DRAFT_3172058 [Mycena olivaceomarginata]|nr:hypothetical protein B0H14DRAFT_3172058 [Mycena olivaceomarginata]